VWDGVGRPILWKAGRLSTDDTRRSALMLPSGAALDVSTRAARRRSAWRLLRASGKPTDGWLARHLHRRISRMFSYALLQLGVTANAATALTFLIGACSAWLVAQTSHETMIGGALLFWFASIADGIDGEMARLTLSESRWGEQLDTAVDHATHFLCYAGLMVGWWRQGIGPRGIGLAVGVAIGIVVALLYGMKIVRGIHLQRAQDRRETQFFVDTKPIELAIAEASRVTGAPALRLASGIFVLFRREVFSLTFFLISLATGQRAVYPALLAAGLAVVTITLIVYRRPIEHALHR
jgi:phosphatidylglycerophosphate synthase